MQSMRETEGGHVINDEDEGGSVISKRNGRKKCYQQVINEGDRGRKRCKRRRIYERDQERKCYQ